jgi:hypothetical protein
LLVVAVVVVVALLGGWLRAVLAQKYSLSVSSNLMVRTELSMQSSEVTTMGFFPVLSASAAIQYSRYVAFVSTLMLQLLVLEPLLDSVCRGTYTPTFPSLTSISESVSFTTFVVTIFPSQAREGHPKNYQLQFRFGVQPERHKMTGCETPNTTANAARAAKTKKVYTVNCDFSCLFLVSSNTANRNPTPSLRRALTLVTTTYVHKNQHCYEHLATDKLVDHTTSCY